MWEVEAGGRRGNGMGVGGGIGERRCWEESGRADKKMTMTPPCVCVLGGEGGVIVVSLC